MTLCNKCPLAGIETMLAKCNTLVTYLFFTYWLWAKTLKPATYLPNSDYRLMYRPCGCFQGWGPMFHDVSCVPSRAAISAQMTNVEGQRLSFVIQPEHAMIDDRGVVRFFSVEFDDGFVGNYKLLPKHSTTAQIEKVIVTFLAGFGLVRFGGKILKGDKEVHNVARYAIFGFSGAAAIRSFVHHMFPEHDLGYFNITSDKLIFPNGVLKAPPGSW
jgi:hypothetical protein